MKESPVIKLITLHLLSVFAVGLFLISTILLYPTGYLANTLSALSLLPVVGMFFIYKKPDIAKSLFRTAAIGTLSVVAIYILTTKQDWAVFVFVFTVLGLSCFLLLFLAMRFQNK